jgi:hypothetical protein
LRPISRFAGSDLGQNRHCPLALHVSKRMPFLNPQNRRSESANREIGGRNRAKLRWVLFQIEYKGIYIGCKIVPMCGGDPGMRLALCKSSSGSFRFQLLGDCGCNFLVAAGCGPMDLPRASSSGSFLFLLLGDCGYNFLAWSVLALTHYCLGIVDTISLRGQCLHWLNCWGIVDTISLRGWCLH